jgi:hypothetical protein
MNPPERRRSKTTDTKPRRPFGVTLIILGVLIITAVNLIRLVEAIRLWDFLAQLPGVSPIYIAASGLVWTMAGLLLTICLWRGLRITYSLLPPAAVLYILYTWVDSSLVGGQLNLLSNRANWPFKAGLSLLVLVFIFWTLTRSSVKTYFGRTL